MTEERPRTVGEDGIFKLLTWHSLAIPRLFGLPDIDGEPIQQEYQFPMQRRVDRLYRLKDGSLLNIEHQSSLSDRDALARRMITYNIMIKEEFPKNPLLQIVIDTGKEPSDRSRIGDRLEYASLDASGRHGIHFSAALRDFRRAPIEEFRRSGRLDDLILGLMTMGGDDQSYIDEVIAHIKSTQGAERLMAIEKFIAVCATMPDRKAGRLNLGEIKMWIDEVKDSPIVKEIVEIAGKGRIEEESRRTLARLLVKHANKLKLDIPNDAESLLLTYATEDRLFEMADDMENMLDFNEFIKDHGVAIPGYTS